MLHVPKMGDISPRFWGSSHFPQLLVASHNRYSIERTIQKMSELGVSQDADVSSGT